jgi:ATP-dependent Lon protease
MSTTEKPGHERAEALPTVPLRDVVVFPHMMMTFVIGRKASIAALEYSLQRSKRLFLTAQTDPRRDSPSPREVHSVGTICQIVQSLRLPDGNLRVLVEGVERAQALEFGEESGFLKALVRPLPKESAEAGSESLVKQVVDIFDRYVKMSNHLHYDAMLAAVRVQDPGKLADTVASHLVLPTEEKQLLLETPAPAARLMRLLDSLQAEVTRLESEKREGKTKGNGGTKTPKEHVLAEKMRTLQKEARQKEERPSELEELKERISKAKMPGEANEKALQELKRLEGMPPMSAEATVSRNYLEWLLAMPWRRKAKESRDIEAAKKILNDDHYGLDKIKERILEFLAVRQLVEQPKGPILCFVGPPGVGKTSLARSIARCTGRPYVRFSLGGVRDEAEIRGHRRTYIGALPGQIVKLMRKAGVRNPVLLLDEVDKMTYDFRGDPSSALLEVLDPEQNRNFADHYLDVDFDLSSVFFIATANTLHGIPIPLQDRLEIVRLEGYTEYEKLEIAKRHLVPKQMSENGVTSENVVFTDDSLRTIVRRYTREAGVRSLEREIGSLSRKVARRVVERGRDYQITLQAGEVFDLLGVPRYRDPQGETQHEIGLATGLAWTEVGGETLPIEVTLMPGRGALTLTGKLGDVMQESARAALSYVRSRASVLGVDSAFHRRHDIHIHVPEGAIPKDGPSAGITIATALLSALLATPVRRDVAMTGEITLRGKVLPIGGVKEKLLAAHRIGASVIILPRENEKDLADVAPEIKAALEIHLVDTVDEVFKIALLPPTPAGDAETASDQPGTPGASPAHTTH